MTAVRQIREEKGLTLAELAERAGLCPSTVDRMERGYNVRLDTIHCVARALGATIEELIATENIVAPFTDMRDFMTAKEYIIALAGAISALENLTHTGLIDDETVTKARELADAIQRDVLGVLVRKTPADKRDAILRYCNNSKITITPKVSPAAERNLMIIEVDDFREIAAQGPCSMCVKEGAQVRKCQTRKIYMRCGMLGEQQRGDCEYKLF